MSQIRSKGMLPELAVRSVVHRLGYRFRLHGKELPGKPDIVFRRLRKAIFVHGCFWHQHNDCTVSRLPKSNRGYWLPKLQRNTQRDAEHQRSLRELGWETLIVWECETRDAKAVAKQIANFLGPRPHRRRKTPTTPT